MDTKKQVVTGPSPNKNLTSAEIGKLWATYMGNSMGRCILKYYLQNVEDQDIKMVLEHGLNLSEDFISKIKDIFEKENFAIPIGFTEEDVNLRAPRLFRDEFYLHYLKYTAKAGLNLYTMAIPLMVRPDTNGLFTYITNETVKFLNTINKVLLAKGYLILPSYIPTPKKIEFEGKTHYLNGFLGNVRSLHSLEIAHLYDNVENNVSSKALLVAFSQVAQLKSVKKFIGKGKEITQKHIETFFNYLHQESLSAHPLLDHLVTESTIPPFSDKLMLYHKIDMFAMKVRSYGNSISVNGRRDVGLMYSKFLLDVTHYSEDGVNIMINEGWFEKPPEAPDRDSLAGL